MEKADANWSVQLMVNCPHCDYYMDIVREVKDWWDMGFPDIPRTEEGVDQEVTCADCNKNFVVASVYN